MIVFSERSPDVRIQRLKKFIGTAISQFHDSFKKVFESGKIAWNIDALLLKFKRDRPEAFVHFLAEFIVPISCCFIGAPLSQESKINRFFAFESKDREASCMGEVRLKFPLSAVSG